MASHVMRVAKIAWCTAVMSQPQALDCKRSVAIRGRRLSSISAGDRSRPAGAAKRSFLMASVAATAISQGNPLETTALQRTRHSVDMLNPSKNLIVLPSAQAEVSESYSATDQEIARAIARAQENLLRQQRPDGHSCGELIVDSTLCSDFVFYMHWAGEVDEQIQQRCIRHILKHQLPDGGWNIYYDGPSEINASVKAYFALKLAGYSADLPFMQEARANILRLGGIPRLNTFSKLYLALLGQFPWKYLPTIPVEMVLLPPWAPLNIYRMSSWSRAMLIPLAIINHFKPTRQLPGLKHLHELYPLGTEHEDFTLPRDPRFFTWRNFFLRADHGLKIVSKLGWRPMRKRALEEAERWMLERIGEGSDGLAAVYPAMLNCLIALRVLGYPKDHS